jgi:hypothetical protein
MLGQAKLSAPVVNWLRLVYCLGLQGLPCLGRQTWAFVLGHIQRVYPGHDSCPMSTKLACWLDRLAVGQHAVASRAGEGTETQQCRVGMGLRQCSRKMGGEHNMPNINAAAGLPLRRGVALCTKSSSIGDFGDWRA